MRESALRSLDHCLLHTGICTKVYNNLELVVMKDDLIEFKITHPPNAREM